VLTTLGILLVVAGSISIFFPLPNKPSTQYQAIVVQGTTTFKATNLYMGTKYCTFQDEEGREVRVHGTFYIITESATKTNIQVEK
jgi:hypothetical protein